MGPSDVFATLFEYGPESVGTALFARQGRPDALSEAAFSPMTLRRGIPGQSGTQWFFTESGRPFTLYIVLGSHTQRSALVPRVNSLIGPLVISPMSGLTAAAATAAPTPTPANSSAPTNSQADSPTAQPTYPPTSTGGARWN